MMKAKRRSPDAPEEDFLRPTTKARSSRPREKIRKDEDNDKKGKIKKKYFE